MKTRVAARGSPSPSSSVRNRTAQALFDEVVWEAARRGLLSDERFSVDGTLIEAQASINIFRRRDD